MRIAALMTLSFVAVSTAFANDRLKLFDTVENFDDTCAAMAAHPEEPGVSSGVEIENIDVRGLEICRLAVSKEGSLPSDHYHLSRMYRAVGKIEEAEKELQIAAEGGYAFAQYKLAEELIEGDPPYYHADVARHWLALAAISMPDALVDLGYLEWNGFGGTKDRLAAIEHERQAALLGNETGAQNLALYESKLAAAQNPVDANGQTHDEAVEEVQRLEWERQQELDRQNCQYNRSFGDAAASWAGC